MDERNAEAAGVAVEDVRGRIEAQIPLGRYGTPEELARVVAFLASPANTPESRSTKRSELRFRASLIDGSQEVYFEVR
jgi:3-oxoacyl-[acyl-carrier protein] reductase